MQTGMQAQDLSQDPNPDLPDARSTGGSASPDTTLDSLLALATRRRGTEVALHAPAPGGPVTLTYAELDQRVARLADLLGQIGLQPGTGLAIHTPMSVEAVQSLIAALRLGLVPFIIPAETEQGELTRLLEESGAEIAIGADQPGLEPLLPRLREAAAHVFSLRCVAGFGRDTPDGVLALDQYLRAASDAEAVAPVGQGKRRVRLCSSELAAMPAQEIEEAVLLEAARHLVRLLDIRPDTRVASTLLGGHLSALVTGPVASLLAGAQFMPLGLFTLERLEAALADGVATYLVVPARTASAFFAAGLAGHPAVAALVLVHDGKAPADIPPLPGQAEIPVVDVFTSTPTTLTLVAR